MRGLNTSNGLVVAEVLRGLGLEAAVKRVTASDPALLKHHAARLQKAQGLMLHLWLQGVPALVVNDDSGPRLLSGHVLYGSFGGLLGHLLLA